MSLKATLGPLVVIAPKRYKLGRVATIVDATWSQYLRLIVPRNGRWWDDGCSGDHGADLVGVGSHWDGAAPQLRIGDWVRVQGRKVTVEDAIPVEPVLEVAGEGTGAFLRVLGVSWVDEWLRRALDGLASDYDTLPWFPKQFGTRYSIYGCSCGEHGCGHFEVRIDHDPVNHRVIWSELMATFSLHLGPALSFDETVYRNLRLASTS